MGSPDPHKRAGGAWHLASRLTAESLQSRDLLRRTDGPAVCRLLPRVTVVKIGGASILDRGPDALMPVIAELGELSTDHPLLITAGEGARACHAYGIAIDLGLPTGMLATLGNSDLRALKRLQRVRVLEKPIPFATRGKATAYLALVRGSHKKALAKAFIATVLASTVDIINAGFQPLPAQATTK